MSIVSTTSRRIHGGKSGLSPSIAGLRVQRNPLTLAVGGENLHDTMSEEENTPRENLKMSIALAIGYYQKEYGSEETDMLLDSVYRSLLEQRENP